MSHFQGGPDDYSCDFPNCEHDFDAGKGRLVAAIKDEKLMVFCEDHSIRIQGEGVRLRSIEEAQSVLILNRQLNNEHDELAAEAEFIRSLKLENY